LNTTLYNFQFFFNITGWRYLLARHCKYYEYYGDYT